MTQSELISALEPLLDASDLSTLTLTLARLCNEKAEHLLSNWQDKNAAKAWDHAASVLDNATRKFAV